MGFQSAPRIIIAMINPIIGQIIDAASAPPPFGWPCDMATTAQINAGSPQNNGEIINEQIARI